jgi:hypothetical protein
MATGAVATHTGRKHTYVIQDANTSLAANDRSLTNRYSILVDGVAEGRTHQDMYLALVALARILRTRDYL